MEITVLHLGQEFTSLWLEHSRHKHRCRQGIKMTDFSRSWQIMQSLWVPSSTDSIKLVATSFSFNNLSTSILYSTCLLSSLCSIMINDSRRARIRRRRPETLLDLEMSSICDCSEQGWRECWYPTLGRHCSLVASDILHTQFCNE